MTDSTSTEAVTTDAHEADSAAAAPRRHSSRIFRPAVKVRLSPESAKRQGAITSLALQLLGSSHAAIALLNQPHAGLGARPLDLATASDEGYADVERVIRQLAAPAGSDPASRDA